MAREPHRFARNAFRHSQGKLGNLPENCVENVLRQKVNDRGVEHDVLHIGHPAENESGCTAGAAAASLDARSPAMGNGSEAYAALIHLSRSAHLVSALRRGTGSNAVRGFACPRRRRLNEGGGRTAPTLA